MLVLETIFQAAPGYGLRKIPATLVLGVPAKNRPVSCLP